MKLDTKVYLVCPTGGAPPRTFHLKSDCGRLAGHPYGADTELSYAEVKLIYPGIRVCKVCSK